MRHLKLLSVLGIACILHTANAGSITDIKISKINNEEQVLQVTFDGPAPVANSFATANPPRVAFDFSDTSVKLSSPQVTLDNPLVRSATAVATGSRARLVLNLNRNASYSSEPSGNTLLIRLNGNPEATAQSSTPVARVAASQMAAPQAYANASNTRIEFHRGSSGEGRIEINLPASNVPVDVRRDGGNLVVDLVGVQLPRSQERKLDVNDFGTPVSKIDARNRGKNGHIVVQPTGAWDFSSYQTDNKLIVEVKRPTTQTANNTQGGTLTSGGVNLSAGQKGDPYGINTPKVYKGEKLSLNFQNIEIRTVLQVIAEFTKLNIVTSDSVTGNITLRLQDVPWDQALDLILETKGLGQRRQNNVIRIAPNAELLADDTAKLEAIQKLQGLEPIVSETFTLRYKKVEEFKEVLDSASNSGSSSGGSDSASLLSNRGSALIDPRNNILIINDTQTVINKIRALVEQLDTPLKQVLIEARVVEANDNFARDLGVKLGFANVSKNSSVASNYDDAITNWNGRSELNLNPNVNLPASISGVSSGTFAVLSRLAGGFINLELSAMQTENKGKIISSPRLLTADRMEASIKEGQEIPYQEATSSGATSTTFKEAVLGMNVKPQITPDGNIIMDVKITKNSVDDTLSGALSVKEINTQVMVENGGTVVIGGIYIQETRETTNRIPYLSNIPVLGALFRERNNTNNRRELLVFLTPRLVDSASMLQSRY